MADEENSSGTNPPLFSVGTEDVVILPMVAIALLVKTVVRSAWTVLKHIFDFLFPVLLQLMRFPLFTLRILGGGVAALLMGIARFLPIGGERRAAWREFVSKQWAWLRQKIRYRAFEEAVHHLFEGGMAWVFRKCRMLTPRAALIVIVGAILWLPISFGVATFLHAVLIAKATSLPAWMQLLHPVATIIAKTKLLVLPVYPAAWPRAKQHPAVQAIIGLWGYFTTLHFIRKSRYRYGQLEGAVAEAVEASRPTVASCRLRSLFARLVAAFDSAAEAVGRRLRNIGAIVVALLASIPLMGTVVRRYVDHYDKANQGSAELLSVRMSGFYSRWSIKFSADYYEARERNEGKSAAKGITA